MRTLIKIYSAILILSIFLIASNAKAQNEDKLSFSISAAKSSYMLGEPVVIKAVITNDGDQSAKVIPFLDPMYNFASYTITYPGDRIERFNPLMHADMLANPVELAPGKSVIDYVPIFHGASGNTFLLPGLYVIIGKYTDIHSEPLTIEITSPVNSNERLVSRLMLRDEVGLFLFAEGGETLIRARGTLNNISRQYPDLVYADYANYALAAYYTKDGRDFKNNSIRKANFPKAESLLVKIVDKRMPSYFQIKNYSNVIKTYSNLKENLKANKYLRKLEMEYGQETYARPYIDKAMEIIRKSQQ